MIIATLLQFVVCFLIMRWVLKQKTGEKYSRKSVIVFFVIGVVSTVLALILSNVMSLERDTFFDMNPYVGGFLTALITAALLEEVSKYILFRLAIMKNKEVVCWLDVIIAAIVYSIGFVLMEDITYSIFGDANILRAILPMHILFQFFMGYYYGKARVTRKFKYHVLSLVIPIICHTLFDMFPISLMVIMEDKDLEAFSKLSNEEFLNLPYATDLITMICGMIVSSIVFLVILIISVRKIGVWSKNGEKQERV